MALILVTAVAGPANATTILLTDPTETFGRPSFADGDLIEYRPITHNAILSVSESFFGNNADTDGVCVASTHEPATIVTLGLGCVILVGQRPEQKKHDKSAGEHANKIIDGLCPGASRHAKTQGPGHKTQGQ